jgi:glycosyltransferase involved in cell wall biosynthesis
MTEKNLSAEHYNIALLHYSCPPVIGGVEMVVSQQASLVHSYSHKVTILAGAGEPLTGGYSVEINGLLGSRNPHVRQACRLVTDRNDTSALDRLVDEIYTYLHRALRDCHILIAHNVMTMPYNLPLTLALLRIAEEGSLPIVSWNHDSPYFYPRYPQHLDVSPWDVLKRFHSCMRCVVISESRRKQFSQLYGRDDQIHVIFNGIDPIIFFGLDPVSLQLIREQELFSEDFLMVQPSRLHPRKNVELSIQVTRALQNRDLKARLLVTGAYDPHEPKTVEYAESLIRLSRELGIEKDVLILADYRFKSGETLRHDRIIMRDLYLISDILFLPSWEEGFGIPLLEAGMMKLPVVCSDIPVFREIGKQDVYFFKLDETPEQIAEKVLRLTAELKPRCLFRRTIRSHSWDNIYQAKLLPLLHQLIP